MLNTFKRFSIYSLVLLNLSAILLLLCGVTASYVNPATYWPVALSGIIFPLMFFVILGAALFWLFINRKKALINLIVLLIALPSMFTSFPIHFSRAVSETKSQGAIRILSWNVGLMNYMQADSNVAIKNNLVIIQKLAAANADILCLQEFFTSITPGNHYNLADSISRTLNYPFYYFSRDDGKFNNTFYNGSIVFSRFPIIDTQKISYPGAFAGSLIKVSLLLHGDTINLINTRLQSVKFKSAEYQDLHQIKSGSTAALQGSKNIVSKLKAGYQNRVTQVNMLRKEADECKYPLIIAGDFNDVPISYAYATIHKGMRNAWEQAGLGFGRTFSFISPTLRIDNIFYSRAYKAIGVRRILSQDETDHHGVLADLILIKK